MIFTGKAPPSFTFRPHHSLLLWTKKMWEITCEERGSVKYYMYRSQIFSIYCTLGRSGVMVHSHQAHEARAIYI